MYDIFTKYVLILMTGLCRNSPITCRREHNGFINERFFKYSITCVTFTFSIVYEEKSAGHIWGVADGLTYRTIIVTFCAVRRKRRTHLDRYRYYHVFIFVYQMIKSFAGLKAFIVFRKIETKYKYGNRYKIYIVLYY
jgi:hypothetical protein